MTDKKIIKFNYSKLWKKNVPELINVFTTFDDIKFWEKCGLEIAQECAIENIYIISHDILKNYVQR